MMINESDFDAAVDSSLARLDAGEPIEDIVGRYPQLADELRIVLLTAQGLRTVVERPIARATATAALYSELGNVHERPSRLPGFAVFALRPLAALVALVAVGGLALGASVATGTTPKPVQSFLRIPAGDDDRVEFEGIVLSNAGGSIVVNARGAEHTVVIGPASQVRRGSDAISAEQLLPGTEVEVKGERQADETVLASRIQADRLDSDGPPDTVPPVQPDIPAVLPPPGQGETCNNADGDPGNAQDLCDEDAPFVDDSGEVPPPFRSPGTLPNNGEDDTSATPPGPGGSGPGAGD